MQSPQNLFFIQINEKHEPALYCIVGESKKENGKINQP